MYDWQSPPAVVTIADSDTDAHERLELAFQRAYRELAVELPRHKVLRALCRALAEDLDVPLQAWPGRRDSGAAKRSDTLLWAELTRFIDDCARIELQRSLAAALADAGHPAFVADSEGRIVYAISALWHINGPGATRAG